jgi:hypothetical protein
MEKNTVDPSHLLLLPAQIIKSDLRSKMMFKLLSTIGEFPSRTHTLSALFYAS